MQVAEQKSGVPIAWRPSYAVGQTPYRDVRPAGESVFDMVMSVPDLPPAFMARGVVLVNGEAVPRHLWANVRPKPGDRRLPVAVTFHLPPRGGGGGGNTGKQIGSIVAALALIVVTQGIAAYGLPGLFTGAGGGFFAAGSTAAKVLAGGIGCDREMRMVFKCRQ